MTFKSEGGLPMITGDEVRQLALSLPETEEHETWGHPTFRVRDKIFASLSPDGEIGGVKASLNEQEMLITTYPETFTVADYVGRFGWVTIQLATANPSLIGELIIEAWRRTAPKRLVKVYDEKR